MWCMYQNVRLSKWYSWASRICLFVENGGKGVRNCLYLGVGFFGLLGFDADWIYFVPLFCIYYAVCFQILSISLIILFLDSSVSGGNQRKNRSSGRDSDVSLRHSYRFSTTFASFLVESRSVWSNEIVINVPE